MKALTAATSRNASTSRVRSPNATVAASRCRLKVLFRHRGQVQRQLQFGRCEGERVAGPEDGVSGAVDGEFTAYNCAISHGC
ncbi:hypothetical protein J7F02_13130 [Streptomyces sp. ISL-112]|uniref:hypothetical protein n=1 Tax=unclassified Streptomyces TaxID=2593676 RepID=UPI001BE5C4AC|nr:hypothetical protein [Streptomyces sp. ISL-112]MBT2465623.1 hypothetical protein [Streptomyces sp. ISL-63]